MAAEQRIKGQEIEIRVLSGTSVVSSLKSISSINHSTVLELKEDGYIGERQNRYDEIFNGYKGDFENQPSDASYHNFEDLVVARARRDRPELVFNIIITEFFPNGSTAVITYSDVKWGGMDGSVGARADYKKDKYSFATETRSVQVNALP
jgi:hypothetical protein